MKININGVTRDMTAEEIAEMEAMRASLPVPELTMEERVTDLESLSDMAYVNSELALALLDGLEV